MFFLAAMETLVYLKRMCRLFKRNILQRIRRRSWWRGGKNFTPGYLFNFVPLF